MSERPRLDRSLDGETFRSYYYLKEELTAFCRENGLPVSGGKLEITERSPVSSIRETFFRFLQRQRTGRRWG